VIFQGRKIKMSMEINLDRLAFAMTIAAGEFWCIRHRESSHSEPAKAVSFLSS
jgi:hypothetical protein